MEWYVGFVDADPKKIPVTNFGWKFISFAQGYSEYENGKLVHVFLIFKEGEDYNVYQTTETVYKKTSLQDRSAGCPLIIYQMPTDGIEALSHVKTLASNKKPYGYVEILGLGCFLLAERLLNLFSWPIRKALKKPYIKIDFKNPFNISLSVYCTESTLDAMAKEGIKSPWYKNHASAMCPTMYEWMDKDPQFQLVKHSRGEMLEVL